MGSCEHGNEPYGSMKDTDFLDQFSDYQFLNVSAQSYKAWKWTAVQWHVTHSEFQKNQPIVPTLSHFDTWDGQAGSLIRFQRGKSVFLES